MSWNLYEPRLLEVNLPYCLGHPKHVTLLSLLSYPSRHYFAISACKSLI